MTGTVDWFTSPLEYTGRVEVSSVGVWVCTAEQMNVSGIKWN